MNAADLTSTLRRFFRDVVKDAEETSFALAPMLGEPRSEAAAVRSVALLMGVPSIAAAHAVGGVVPDREKLRAIVQRAQRRPS